jgi:AraC-like DNA-binding protein
MKDNLTNSDVDVSYMARSLGVSRSQLFRKVKALTGETPHGFFNKYKLNVAAEWLLESKNKISVIASDLGFDSAPHFSAIFKKEFGCLPSEYKKLRTERERIQ